MFSIASRNKGQLNVFIAVLYSMMIGVAYYGRLYNCGREHLRAGDSGALPLYWVVTAGQCKTQIF